MVRIDRTQVAKQLVVVAEAPPEMSEDRLTYTIKIRDGVKWHDGQPFTPEDVLFTFKATACPLTDAASLRSYLTDLSDIQLDGRTLRFTMSKPNVYNARISVKVTDGAGKITAYGSVLDMTTQAPTYIPAQ